jgi:hypothetical protein
MNKHLKMMALAVGVMVIAAPAFAATVSSGPVNVNASVNGDLSMTLTLRQNSSTGAVVSSMDFGQLVESVPGELRSSSTSTTGTGSVVASITANSHGVPYSIKQTGTALSNGTVTIPAGACTVVPVYATQDNGGASLPSGAALGTAGTWVASDKVLYTSETTSTAALRTIQNHYSVTGDPAAGATAAVPVNQPGGSYSSTVTFTVTA